MFKELICPNCEESLQKIINAMCEGYAVNEIICDDNGRPTNYRFMEVNRSFLQMTGFKREDILGKTVKDISPNIDANLIDAYGKVALTGSPANFENYSELLDKHFRVSVFSPKKGTFITMFTDISEMKRTEETLKKHKLLIECAQDAVLYVKDDGMIVDANEAAQWLYNYTYEELLQLSIHDIRHPATKSEFEQQMKQADKYGIVFECIHVRKDGSSFPVEVSAKGTIIENRGIRIHIIRDITERKLAEEKITYLANYDSLTGIPNRAYLMHELDMSIQRASRGEDKFAVLFFDIDKFKLINDMYGHDAGDKVLQTVSARVQSLIRKIDTLGRLGGDEFIIIQPLIEKAEDALPLVHRIFKAFDEPITVGSNYIKVIISVGISIYPDNGEDKEALLSNADNAMYAAKKEKGNSYKFYMEKDASV